MILHTTNSISSFIFNLYDKQSLALMALHSIFSKFPLFINSMDSKSLATKYFAKLNVRAL